MLYSLEDNLYEDSGEIVQRLATGAPRPPDVPNLLPRRLLEAGRAEGGLPQLGDGVDDPGGDGRRGLESGRRLRRGERRGRLPRCCHGDGIVR